MTSKPDKKKISFRETKEKIVTFYKKVVNYYKDKIKENPNLKILQNCCFTLFSINILLNIGKYVYEGVTDSTDYKIGDHPIWRAIIVIFGNPFFTFIEHFWIEIFSGIIIYILLDDRIKQITEVPQKLGERQHKKLLEAFETSARIKIRILDTSIYSFIQDQELFYNSLNKALKVNEKLIVEILLLHPDTYAAEQRSKDLSLITKTYLKRMKIGLYRLNEFKKSLPPKSLDRVHIKLFKATPMMIYASWDGKVNFNDYPLFGSAGIPRFFKGGKD